MDPAVDILQEVAVNLSLEARISLRRDWSRQLMDVLLDGARGRSYGFKYVLLCGPGPPLFL